MRSTEEASKIAILVRKEGSNETLVKYRQIDRHADEAGSDHSIITFDELPKSYFVSGCDGNGNSQKNPSTLNKSCSKSLSLSHAATYDAAIFLSDKFPRYQSRKKKKGPPETASNAPAVSTGHAALILSRDNKSGSTFNSPQYHAVTFSLPQPTTEGVTGALNLQKYHELLMIRQPGLQRSGPMSLSKDLWSFEAFTAVEMCTGMCLFSEQDLSLCIQNGSIQPAQLAQLPISLSEKEIITRLSTTIANTAGLYFHGCETRQHRPLRINIDIPSVQYYRDALNAYSEGKCRSQDVLDWIAAIRGRRHLLFDAFAKAIRYGLNERCVPADAVEVILSCGLNAADEGIFCALRVSPSPADWLQLILDSVLGDSKEFWASFMDLVGEDERKPRSWRQFSTLSYMYEVAKPVLRARSAVHVQSKADGYFNTTVTGSALHTLDAETKTSSASATRVLLLAIDDIDECRIYTKAYQALCRLSTTSARSPGVSSMSSVPVTTRILTICPAPQVIFGMSGPELDWTRPSLWRAPLRNSEANEPALLQFRTEEDLLKTDSDILKEVYNEELVTRLENWVQK